MNKQDEELQINNVRILAAAYFGLLAIIGTAIIDTLLYLLGVPEIISIFKSVILSTILAAIFGALFANKIVHSAKPYQLKAFGWGVLIVLISLPIYNLFLVLFIAYEHAQAFTEAQLVHYITLYFIYLFFTFILAGLWLAILSGLAAMYLRGQLIYDIFRSQNQQRERPLKKQTKMHRSDTPHRVKPKSKG